MSQNRPRHSRTPIPAHLRTSQPTQAPALRRGGRHGIGIIRVARSAGARSQCNEAGSPSPGANATWSSVGDVPHHGTRLRDLCERGGLAHKAGQGPPTRTHHERPLRRGPRIASLKAKRPRRAGHDGPAQMPAMPRAPSQDISSSPAGSAAPGHAGAGVRVGVAATQTTIDPRLRLPASSGMWATSCNSWSSCDACHTTRPTADQKARHITATTSFDRACSPPPRGQHVTAGLPTAWQPPSPMDNAATATIPRPRELQLCLPTRRTR